MLTAEIIAIGDELLNGDVIDTNSNFIAGELNKISIPLQTVSQIHDDPEAISKAVSTAIHRSKIIIMTGGLGPTNDDITKNSLARIFNSKLEFLEEVFVHIEKLFSSRSRFMPEVNREQALFPHNAKVIFNKVGTAPGIHYSLPDNRHLFALPGVPFETNMMVREYIIPLLKNLNTSYTRSIDIQTNNIGESHLFSLISDVPALEKLVKLAFLPKSSGVLIRLNADGTSQDEVDNRLATALEMLQKDISQHISYIGSEKPAERVLKRLEQQNFKISVAESCTGGLISAMLTDYPGSSKVFEESFITYSNDAKFRLLGVNPRTLSLLGAVSEETVSEMLDGLLAQTKAQVVGAVSGIAGPDGGTPDKPVGTVFIGCAQRDGQKLVKRYQFWGDRKNVRERTANSFFLQVLDMLK